MTCLRKKIGLGLLLCAAITTSHAASKDYAETAELCRQSALKLDWLGRYQDRMTCTANMDSTDTYTASKYILNNQLKEASTLIAKVIILTNFTIDIGCYGQDELKTLVKNLQTVQTAIA